MDVKTAGFLLLVLTMLTLSCERDVALDVIQQQPKIVVDASIENGGFPRVILTTSLNYFSTLSPEELANSFEHNALIQISDGTTTAQLKEYALTDSSGYTVYYYSADTANPFSVIVGKFNTTYNLRIEITDGSIYTATTTIPFLTKTCDSLWWTPAPDKEDSALCLLYGRFTDPPGLGNYVRYFTSENGSPFLPGFTSAFDDQVVDGTSYDFFIPRGFNKADTTAAGDDDTFSFFRRGDTAVFKFCNIDKDSYDFWRTWEYAYQSNGNPFSAPTVIKGNISNGGLGVFCGYAAQYRTIIIPPL